MNKAENHFMKQLIKNYIQLLRNFNEENLTTLQNVQKEGLNSQAFIESSKYITNLYDDIGGKYLANKNISYSPIEQTNLSQSNSMINNSLITNNQNLSGINTSNSIMESHNDLLKLKRHSSLLQINKNEYPKKHKQSNKKEKILENFVITNKKIVNSLTKKPIQIEIWMFYLLLFLLILIIAMVVLNTLYLNKFHNFIMFSEKIFDSYTYYYYTIPVAFNLIRKTLMSKSLPTQILQVFVGSIHESKDEKEKFKNSHDIQYFSNLQKASIHGSYSTVAPNVDLDFLCNSNELCMKMLKTPNGYCSLGILLGTDLVAQKLQEIISDLFQLTAVNRDYTENDLKVFLKEQEFEKIQENVDLVFSQIQNLLYKSFMQDYLTRTKSLNTKSSNINLAFWIVEIASILIITGFILQVLKYKKYIVELGSNKFHTSFFKNAKKCN